MRQQLYSEASCYRVCCCTLPNLTICRAASYIVESSDILYGRQSATALSMIFNQILHSWDLDADACRHYTRVPCSVPNDELVFSGQPLQTVAKYHPRGLCATVQAPRMTIAVCTRQTLCGCIADSFRGPLSGRADRAPSTQRCTARRAPHRREHRNAASS